MLIHDKLSEIIDSDNLHIKQTEIFQRGYSIVLKLPSTKADLIFVSYTL